MSEFYDRQGHPMTLIAWAESFENNRQVALTILKDGTRISTIWLGLDHGRYFGHDAPLIFETMVFPSESYTDLDCQRYSTEAEAVNGHAHMVEKWTNLSTVDTTNQPTRQPKELPPRVTTSNTQDTDRSLEYQWIQDRWQDYRGQWVAVNRDVLVAAAASLKELQEIPKQMKLMHPPLVHRIGEHILDGPQKT